MPLKPINLDFHTDDEKQELLKVIAGEDQPEYIDTPRQADPDSNSISRDEFARSMAELGSLLGKLIDAVKQQPAPVVNVVPNLTVEATLKPNRKTISRDQLGRITEVFDTPAE